MDDIEEIYLEGKQKEVATTLTINSSQDTNIESCG